MIVPQFWAEGRRRIRVRGRQFTIRRFGWSDVGQSEAQAHAEARVQEAIEQVRRGIALSRRDHKVSYNGAEGIPIREEIVERFGETVITRNSYGARCLNTPRIMFLDIDRDRSKPTGCYVGFLFLIAIVVGLYGLSKGDHQLIAASALGFLVLLVFTRLVRKLRSRAEDNGSEPRMLATIQRFLESRPDWKIRVYRTPNGLRLLVMHRTFDPRSPEAEEAYRELDVDPIYAMMCRNQNCFRARVSPKPWRIGIREHLRPRPGVWPINPDRLPERREWVANYEAIASNFASCQLITEMGFGTTHPEAETVRLLHDRLCRALDDRPMA